MAARASVILNICDVGAYEMERMPGQAMRQKVKEVLRILSKKLTSNKNRNMFRARLADRIASQILLNGGLTISVNEMLDWQEEEERAGDAKEQTTIKVVVCNDADRDERTACEYYARGNCHFGQNCRNSHA